MTEYPLFKNAKLLVAASTAEAIKVAKALELDSNEWAVAHFGMGLTGFRLQKAVVIWPAKDRSLIHREMQSRWIQDSLMCRLPSGVEPVIIY